MATIAVAPFKALEIRPAGIFPAILAQAIGSLTDLLPASPALTTVPPPDALFLLAPVVHSPRLL